MKIKDAINMANLMEQGNVLPKELAILFLSELDGMIQSDIMLCAPEEIVSYDNEEQELLLRPPHDKLYVHYLVMMIRNQQQEYEGYQNTQAAVDEKLKTFRRWYVQHYRPADTDSRSYMGGTSADAFGFAYLTAYGLAVKHGYQGTEEEWLESLRGATGDPGAPAWMRYDAQREMIQWGVGEVWYDLFDLQTMRDPVVEEFLAEAEASAQSAVRSEQAANRAAGTAQSASSQSQTAAQQAEMAQISARDSALVAQNSADQAAVSRNLAMQARQEAEAAAENAAQLRGEVRSMLDDTEAAAQGAEAASERAEAASDRAEAAVREIDGAVAGHNASEAAHPDIRNAISDAIDNHDTNLMAHLPLHQEVASLRSRLNAALNSDDVTLDQMAEIVAYIKNNKGLIDAITTSKVSVSDIVDDLVTDAADKPLSANGGRVLKNLIDLTDIRLVTAMNERVLKSELPEAINAALAQAQESGAFDGPPGDDYVLTDDDRQEIAEQAAEMVGVPEERAFELIEQVETSEEIAKFYRDAEPDGKPYDFKRLYMRVITPAVAGTSNIAGMIKINGMLSIYASTYIATAAKRIECVAEVRNGALRVDGRCHHNNPESQNVFSGMYYNGYMALGETNIRSVETNPASGEIPVGTTFEIWGVRA